MNPLPPGRCLLRRLALLAITVACTFPASAAAVEVPPAAGFFFQTNGPASAMSNGDWYTSTAAGGGAGYHYLQVTIPCGWPSSEPVHLDLFSPEMNRDAGALGGNEEPLGNYDSTQFELYGPGVAQGPAANQPGPGTGISGSRVTYRPTAVGTPEAWTRYFTLPAPVACGNYLLRAEVLPAGADPLNAGAEGDDQNGWKLRVGRDDDALPTNTPPANTDDYDGVVGTNDELSIGFVQSTFQHSQAGTPCQTMYESVSPGTPSVRFHNFDFDGAGTANRVRYYSPAETVDPNALSGGTVGTLSGNNVWNGSATPSRVGDLINNPVPGVWAIVSCINGNNQFIQEAQSAVASSYTPPTTPVMDVTKTDGLTETSRGEELTYTVDVSNTASGTSAGAASNVSVVDTLPANTTFVSCQIKAPLSGTCSASGGTATAALSGDLDAGSSFQVEYVVTVNANADGSVANTVKVSSTNSAGVAMPEPTASDSDTLHTEIGDLVWDDQDGDAVRDPGEPGVGGVTVQLRDPVTNNLIDTTTTAADGSYTFLNHTSGDYRVDPVVPSPWVVTTANDPMTVTIPGTGPATVLTADFGLRRADASIGDLVWDDQDGDGTKDAGEPGLGGVTVRLFASDGTTQLSTTTTSGAGAYSFSNLVSGTYVVKIDDPANYLLTTGSDPTTVNLATSAAHTDADFGFRRNDASIAGTIYDDEDDDGTRDAGEGPRAGVTVRLFAADGTTQLTTTTTGALGTYAFSSLLSGTYVVKVDAPSGTTLTSPHPLTVSPTPGQALAGVDFGIATDPIPIEVTADDKVKTYGDADPSFTWSITSGSLEPGDTLTGVSCGVSGGHANVGGYSIECSGNTNDDYAVTYVPGTLTVQPRPVTVTADDKSKVYGQSDPALTFSVTAGSLEPGDSLSGSLTRDVGESVGGYAITQGTLAAGSNYDLTFVAGELSIAPKPITVTADDKSKVYGQSDPALTYSVTSGGLEPGDSFSGSLERDAGEDVGAYEITQGTLSTNSNYDLTYVPGELSIAPKPITVTADDKSKVYGQSDPALTFSVTAGSLEPGDSFSGALERDAGEDVGTYDITGGTLSAGSNYDLTFVAAELSITPKPITVTADDKSKVYGQSDPALTFSVTAGSLEPGDSFSGALERDAGEDVGAYEITQGTLSTNPNYDLTYVPGELAIAPKPITVRADDKSKVEGDADPPFTWSVPGGVLESGDKLSGVACGVADGHDTAGTYDVECTGGGEGNYAVTYENGSLRVDPRPIALQPKIVVQNPCLLRPVDAWVGGKSVRRVIFYLDGRRVSTARRPDRSGRFGVTIQRTSLSPGRHRLVAKVIFRRAAHRPPKMLSLRIKRCLRHAPPKVLSTRPDPGCGTRSFLVWVKGDRIRRVRFRLDGRKIGTRAVADWKKRYAVMVDPVDLPPGMHRVTAKVKFIRRSGLRPQTVKLDFRRCR